MFCGEGISSVVIKMLVYGNLESYLYAQCIYLVETQFQLIEYGFHRNSARRLVLQTWGVHGVVLYGEEC